MKYLAGLLLRSLPTLKTLFAGEGRWHDQAFSRARGEAAHPQLCPQDPAVHCAQTHWRALPRPLKGMAYSAPWLCPLLLCLCRTAFTEFAQRVCLHYRPVPMLTYSKAASISQGSHSSQAESDMQCQAGGQTLQTNMILLSSYSGAQRKWGIVKEAGVIIPEESAIIIATCKQDDATMWVVDAHPAAAAGGVGEDPISRATDPHWPSSR